MSARFQVPPLDTLTKELTDFTIAEYKRHLNHLAKRGFFTTTLIMEDLAKTAKAVRELAPEDTAEDRKKRRVYISAINWVLPNLKRNSNPLHELYNASLPPINDKTGRVWLKRKDYKPPSV